jgi:hypothetical protein
MTIEIGGVTLTAPTDLQVTGEYKIMPNDAVGGLINTPLWRYRPNGTGYFRPRHDLRVEVDDLCVTEKDALLAQLDDATVYWSILRMSGLGITLNAVLGGTEADAAYVMLGSDNPVTVTCSQGWKVYNGSVVGPALYNVSFSLISGDILYTVD